MTAWTVTLSYTYQIDDAPNSETALDMAREGALELVAGQMFDPGSVVDVQVSDAFPGSYPALRESRTGQLTIESPSPLDSATNHVGHELSVIEQGHISIYGDWDEAGEPIFKVYDSGDYEGSHFTDVMCEDCRVALDPDTLPVDYI